MKFQRVVWQCALFIGVVVVASITHAAERPLKVFVLAGQSNMQGHAHARTLDALQLDPRTRPMLQEIRNSDGEVRIIKDVYISSIGSSEEEKAGPLTVGYGPELRGPKIGPELTFGIYMHKWLGEPILIIKTAWGGKSLHTDFRPPSAGPYEFNESQLAAFEQQQKDLDAIRADKVKATGHYYRLMIEHVNKVLDEIGRVYPDYDPDHGYELAGFVWFQGWNDMVDRGVYPTRDQPGGYDQYSEVLSHFIRDVRKDLKAPALPFVIGVLGVGGPTDQYSPDQMRYKPIHDNFRNAMAAPAEMPQFQGNVTAVRTEKFWDMKLAGLRAREASIKQQVNQQKQAQNLDREAEQALLQKLRDEEFTDFEREYLEKSVSNAEFHYLGSARILGEIGKGFAEAMAAMLLQIETVPGDRLDQSSARELLRDVVRFYRSHVGHRGAYLWRYGADLSWQEGEGVATRTSGWTQPPGTPAVGEALLDAYQYSGEPICLAAAQEAAEALVEAQLQSGGWASHFDLEAPGRSKYAYRSDGDRAGKSNYSTFDDDKTQSALRFLMRMDQALNFENELIHDCVQFALRSILQAQYPNGGWPQQFDSPSESPRPVSLRASFPKDWPREFPQQSYRHYYTLNDNNMSRIIEMLLDAHRVYGRQDCFDAAIATGDFFLLAQMPDPQPGWAQQYDLNMHPAWARRFEPPAVTGGESQTVMRSLIALYRITGETRFIEPLPRALQYYRGSQLDDGKLARFYELQSNRPLYFDREYRLTYDNRDVPTHYSFTVSSRLDSIAEELERTKQDKRVPIAWLERMVRPLSLSKQVERTGREVAARIDDRGAWVEETQGRKVIDMKSYASNLRKLAQYAGAKP